MRERKGSHIRVLASTPDCEYLQKQFWIDSMLLMTCFSICVWGFLMKVL